MKKRVAAVLLALLMLCGAALTGAAESTVFKMEDDFESYREDMDMILSWGTARGNKAVTLHLDTTGALNGQNSLRADYDLSKKPGWATFIHYQNDETAREATPQNCDGLKVTMKATGPVLVRIGWGFDWDASYHWVYVDETPRQYTFRFEDFKNEGESDIMKAEALTQSDFVVFGNDQVQGFATSGSVWYDDICFFKGDDPTYCGSPEEIRPKPTTTTEPPASEPDGTTTGSEAGATTSGTGKTAASGRTTASGAAAASAQPADAPAEKNSVLPVVLGVLGGMVLMVGIGAALWFLVLKKKQA